jgi:hypothetical protein
MARDRHEQRFLDFTRFVLPGREVGQEISIPRKARRLDALFRVDKPPGILGPSGSWLQDRAVIFEHESGQIPWAAVCRALVGSAWLTWRHAIVREPRPTWGRAAEGDKWLLAIEHAPVVVVVAQSIQDDAVLRTPNLISVAPGVWVTRHIELGGLILIDIGRLPERNGWSFWKLTSRGATEAERQRRLEALRTDEDLPKTEREALLEAIAMEHVPTTLEEKRAALNRERRDAFEAGERRALLAIVSAVAPELLGRLEGIQDLRALENEVMALVARRRT